MSEMSETTLFGLDTEYDRMKDEIATLKNEKMQLAADLANVTKERDEALDSVRKLREEFSGDGGSRGGETAPELEAKTKEIESLREQMSSVSQKQIGLYERAERAEREARYAKNSSEEAKTKLSALQKRYDKLVVSILKLKALARAEE